MDISHSGAYQSLEPLVTKGLVDKVYEDTFRIDRKPAYYYLNKQGVTAVRKLMGVKETVVHALYKNDTASPEFIEHCLVTAYCYVVLVRHLPADTDVFTKAEINHYSQFPKNRPDIYIRTSDGREAVIVIMDDKPLYIVRKRLDEVITHSENEGWEDGDYPRIGFILRTARDKNSFLYSTNKKLESMGMDEDDIHILISSLESLEGRSDRVWVNTFKPKSFSGLFG